MDAKTISILAARDPNARLPNVTVTQAIHKAPGSILHKQCAEYFESMYMRVSFGWYIAKQFADKRMMFPLEMTGRDAWVYRAYLMRLDPVGFFDQHIAEAYHFAHILRNKPQYGDDLRTLLLTLTSDHPVCHMQEVARRTGIPYDTIEAFESLFYNVLDRREDRLYIAKQVYPDTRIVEYDDNYMKNATIGDLMKRTGYNYRDMELAEYLIGMGDRAYMARISSSENREAELAKHIMGNGLILTRTSLMNQPSVGLNRTITLMAAARQGGSAAEEPITSGMADILDSQLATVRVFSEGNLTRLLREDAAQVVDVSSSRVDT